MDYSVQSLHRLPVLNYGISHHDKGPKTEEKNIAYTTNDLRKKNYPRERTFDVGPKPSNKKIIVSAKTQKSQLRRKPANLKNIKEKLSACSNYLRGRVQHNTLQYRKIKKQNITSKPSNEIKVLFTSNNYKKNKQRKINQALIHDIYDLDEKFLCNNYIEEFNEPYNIVNCEVLNKPKQNIRKTFALSDLKYNNLRNSSSTPSYGYNIPTHYKIINFPNYDVTDVELEEINFKRGNLNNCQCQTENEIGLQKVEKVALTTSNSQKGGGDCPTVGNQCELKEVCIKSEQPENESKLKDNCCDTFKILYNPTILHENAIHLAKMALRIIIFALALIIWSPCIFALFFCWIVTYPLRPEYIHRNSRSKSKPVVKTHAHRSKHVVDNSIQTRQNSDTYPPFTRGINWAINSIALSFGVIKSLLHLGKNDPDRLYYPTRGKFKSYGNKSRLMTSNPKNKYTLYYSRNKGWVMKSTQRNRRDNSSQCRRKCVRTVSSEPYRCKCNIKLANGVNARNLSQSQGARRCQSYPGKLSVTKYQPRVESSLPCCCHNRHRHLYRNNRNSGLPFRGKLVNPVFNKTNLKRHAYSENSFHQTLKSMPPLRRISKSFIKQGPPTTFGNKLYRYCKETVYNINRVIDDVETEIWRNNTYRGDTYAFTLRRKPCFFVYKICPSLYPFCQTTYKLYVNLCRFMLLVISGCIWCPLLGCCYMCYVGFCRSL